MVLIYVIAVALQYAKILEEMFSVRLNSLQEAGCVLKLIHIFSTSKKNVSLLLRSMSVSC